MREAMKIILLIIFSQLIFPICIQLYALYIYSFRDTPLPDNDRVSALLSLMTIDDKIKDLSVSLEIPRLGIRNTGHSEGLHGPAWGGS